MSNRNYNNQTNPNRQKLMNGGRAKKIGWRHDEKRYAVWLLPF